MHKLNTWLLQILESLMAVCLLAIAAIVVLQVILSSGFNSSITGANEIITKLFVYVTAIGAAVAVGRREHIAITVATESMPPRMRWLSETVGIILVAILNLIVVAYSYHWISVTGQYLMPTTQLPRFLAQLAVPIGAALAVLFCVGRLFSARSREQQVVEAEQ